MTLIYDVLLVRNARSKPDVCIFYDEDRNLALDEMGKYVSKNGFTIYEKGLRFTVSDVVLRERESTGKEISRTSFHQLFDVVTGKLKTE